MFSDGSLPAMLDLRDDGTIGIDFDSGTIILKRPTLGTVEQLDIKRAEIGAGLIAITAEINDRQPPPSVADAAAENRSRSRELIAEWWALAAKLFEVELPPVDDWPSYLVYGRGVLATMIGHWNEVPLARGGQLIPREPAE